ncbi:VOC family protein [Cohnella yongneupensis]|uniref:VOC family protein n=1 Tax=Cohnella yongneupensis TaxID=425006 RepID=A0ABW0QV27_9BACL
MKSIATPFTGGVPAVFVHVNDIAKSVEWYCHLLGIDKPQNIRDDIHIFSLNNGANIFLKQSTASVKPSEQVLFSLPAPDLDKTRAFFELSLIEYSDIDNEVIHFKDIDGNIIMACSI